MEPKVNKALVVDEVSSDKSPLIRRLKSLGFLCAIARSFYEAKAKVSAEAFDIVLSKISMNGGTTYELQSLLIGSPASLFYSITVDEDCWWIQGVCQGKECTGESALNPEEFFQRARACAGQGQGQQQLA